MKDLASSNGTFVGGKRIARETRLVNGDRLQLGAAVIDVKILAPDAASERTALMSADQLPDAPPLAGLPDSGTTRSRGSRIPALAAPERAARPGCRFPRPTFSATWTGRTCREPSLVVDVFPPMGGAPDEVSTIAPPLRPSPAPSAAPPPPRELADFSIRLNDAEQGGARPRSASGRRTCATAARPPTTRARATPRTRSPRLLAALVDAVILAAINVLLFAPVFLIDYFRSELQTRDAAPDWAFRAITGLSILLAVLANILYVVGGLGVAGPHPGQVAPRARRRQARRHVGERHRLAVRLHPGGRLRPRGPPARARLGLGPLREGEARVPGPRGGDLGDQGPLSVARSEGLSSASSARLPPPRSRHAPSARRARARRRGSVSPSRT